MNSPDKGYNFSKITEKAGAGAVGVIYENEDVALPFPLEDAGIFVDPGGNEKIKTHSNHHRAAWREQEITDKSGNTYFVITTKGVGYLYPETYTSKKDDYRGHSSQKEISMHKSKEYGWGYNVLGLFDRRNLAPLIENAREMEASGMRCEKIVGAMEMKKFIINGEVNDISQLRLYLLAEAEEADLSEKVKADLTCFEPVQIVRLSREAMRIKDFCESGNAEKEIMLKKTLANLNRENESAGKAERYDFNDKESIKSYLKDFFAQAGKNLAILHNEGKIMCFLNSGNITLSLAEVVDLDSLIHLTGDKLILSPLITPDMESGLPKGYVKDARDEIYALKMLLKSFEEILTIREEERNIFLTRYMKSYLSVSDRKKLEKLKIDAEILKKIVSDFAEKMILKNESARRLKYLD